MNNIKDYREKELKMYIVANIFVLLVLSNIIDITSDSISWIDRLVKLVNTSLVSSAIYMFAFLADAVFSSDIKTKLLYLIGHLPGEVIFTSLRSENKDLRFSTEQLLKKYKEIYAAMPEDKTEKYRYENEQWYRIYNRYRDVAMIFVSNREYLLCRDLYISTIIIFICYTSSCACLPLFSWNARSIVYCIIMIFITNIAAHVKGQRLVVNVIAYDLNISSNNPLISCSGTS